MGDVAPAVPDSVSGSVTNQLWYLEQTQGTTSGSASSEDFRDSPSALSCGHSDPVALSSELTQPVQKARLCRYRVLRF